MSWIDTLTEQAEETLSIDWDTRSGNVVPDSKSVALANGAVEIEAVFLYADLAGSSRLAQLCPWKTTAKIIRAYLTCCTRLIRAYRGEIRSFDGDRVMAIFKGENKETDAVKCAREIDWVVENILKPKSISKFESIRKNNIELTHCVGIDIGQVQAVHAGIRDNDDLIWIGRAASMAAKLSDLRNYPYTVYITNALYLKLPKSQKFSTDEEKIWEQREFSFAGEKKIIYRTRYFLEP